MSYTYDGINNTLSFDNEASAGSPQDWAYYVGLVSSEVGHDGVNPPLWMPTSDIVIHNTGAVTFNGSHLADIRKFVVISDATYGTSTNVDILEFANGSSFTDGTLVDATERTVLDGSCFLYEETISGGRYSPIIQSSGTGIIALYGTKFISNKYASRVRCNSTGPNYAYGCYFEGVSILDSKNTTVTAPRYIAAPEGGYENRLGGFEGAIFDRVTFPIYRDFDSGITALNPLVYKNPTFIDCDYTFRRQHLDTMVLDGTWINSPFSSKHQGTANDPYRSFSLSAQSDQASANWAILNGTSTVETISGQNVEFQPVKYGSLDLANEVSQDVTIETLYGPFELRCGKPGCIRQDRSIEPLVSFTDDVGRIVETVGPVSRFFALATDLKVQTAGYSAATITIDHTLGSITVTGDHTTQQIYDACNTDINSISGIEYAVHFDLVSNQFVTSYDLIVDNATVTGNVNITGDVSLINGGAVIGFVSDSGGIGVGFSASGGGSFKGYIINSDTNAPLGDGFYDSTTSISLQIPSGTNLRGAFWQLGKRVKIISLSSVSEGVASVIDFEEHEGVNATIDVSAFTSDISIDLVSSPGDFQVVFDAAMTLSAIESNAVMHQIAGYEEGLQVAAISGTTESAPIYEDRIEINTPTFFLVRGAGLALADRVEILQYIDTTTAETSNPSFVLNPSDASNQFVLYNKQPYAVDYNAIRNAMLSAPTTGVSVEPDSIDEKLDTIQTTIDNFSIVGKPSITAD